MNAKTTVAAASGLALLFCAGTAHAYPLSPSCDPEGISGVGVDLLGEGWALGGELDDGFDDASGSIFDTGHTSFSISVGASWHGGWSGWGGAYDWCGPRWWTHSGHHWARPWGSRWSPRWGWSRPSWYRGYSGWYVRPRVIYVDPCPPRVIDVCTLPVVYPPTYVTTCEPVYPVYPVYPVHPICGPYTNAFSLGFYNSGFSFSFSFGDTCHSPGYVTHWPLGYSYHPWSLGRNYVEHRPVVVLPSPVIAPTPPAPAPPRVIVNAPNNTGTIIVNRPGAGGSGTVVTDNGVVSRVGQQPAPGTVVDRGRRDDRIDRGDRLDRADAAKGQREPTLVRTSPGQVVTGGVVTGPAPSTGALARGEAPAAGRVVGPAPRGSPEDLSTRARAEADAEVARIRARVDMERALVESRGRSAASTTGPSAGTATDRAAAARGSAGNGRIEVPANARRVTDRPADPAPARIEQPARAAVPTPPRIAEPPARTATPQPAGPRTLPTRAEPARSQPSRIEQPRVDQPRVDQPRVQQPRVEQPKPAERPSIRTRAPESAPAVKPSPASTPTPSRALPPARSAAPAPAPTPAPATAPAPAPAAKPTRAAADSAPSRATAPAPIDSGRGKPGVQTGIADRSPKTVREAAPTRTAQPPAPVAPARTVAPAPQPVRGAAEPAATPAPARGRKGE